MKLLACRLDNSLPTPPSATTIASFQARFSKDEEVVLALKSHEPVDAGALMEQVRKLRLASRNSEHQALRSIEDDLLIYCQTQLVKVGLLEWRPNFTDSPYSTFNSALRLIAISTFKQITVSGAYTGFGPDLLVHVESMSYVINLFDHFVFKLLAEAVHPRTPTSRQSTRGGGHE